MLCVDKCEALFLRQASKNDIRNLFFPVYIEALDFERYVLKGLQDIEADQGYLDVVYIWSGLVSVCLLVSFLDLMYGRRLRRCRVAWLHRRRVALTQNSHADPPDKERNGSLAGLIVMRADSRVNIAFNRFFAIYTGQQTLSLLYGFRNTTEISFPRDTSTRRRSVGAFHSPPEQRSRTTSACPESEYRRKPCLAAA